MISTPFLFFLSHLHSKPRVNPDCGGLEIPTWNIYFSSSYSHTLRKVSCRIIFSHSVNVGVQQGWYPVSKYYRVPPLEQDAKPPL